MKKEYLLNGKSVTAQAWKDLVMAEIDDSLEFQDLNDTDDTQKWRIAIRLEIVEI